MLGEIILNNKYKDTSDIYFKPLTFENITSTWNIVKKTCKNKKAIFNYCINSNTMNYIIYNNLLNCTYKPYKFKLFLIYEPKPRIVMSQIIQDKIVNHFVANYYLLPYLENKLIDSNVATRKGKGSSYADKLFNDYINKIRIKYPNEDIYVLKIDISKYFYTIPHDILIDKLEKVIKDNNVLNLIKIIINETDSPYINETIIKLNKLHNTSIPLYKKGVGLSIGAMTSQFLAIFYLNDLDHYIKSNLGCKYYIRYMDDFIILDTNKNNLKYIFSKIEVELSKLKLKVNPKSSITNLNTGIIFLGYKYRIINNKYCVKLRNKTVHRIKHKLFVLKRIDILKYYKSYSSYYGYLRKIKYLERNFIMSTIEKYDYYKSKYNNFVVFIKSGSFYKTYKNDAIIIWNLFRYKWNKSSIAFSINYCSKVLDSLKSQSIGYILVDSNDNVIEVTGNNDIYDLIMKISFINYDKFKMSNLLHEKLDKIIDLKYEYSNSVLEYFNSILE